LSETGSERQLNDGDLVRRTQRGSIEAFDELVTRYRKGMYRLAFAMTQRHESADDLSQEAFVQAFRRIRQLKSPDSFAAWLRKILVNLCIRYASKARPVSLEDDEAEMPTSESTAALAEKNLMRRNVREAILQLEPEARAVVLLHYIEGLKQSEIAEVLGCPIGTVWSRLNSARAKLRERLGDLMGQGGDV